MIVTCEQCQTRFRLPDEKVPAGGLRVRCAKCAHTFRVFRADQPPPLPPAPNPFAELSGYVAAAESQPLDSLAPISTTPTPAPMDLSAAEHSVRFDFDSGSVEQPQSPSVAPFDFASMSLPSLGEQVDADALPAFDFPPPGASVGSARQSIFGSTSGSFDFGEPSQPGVMPESSAPRSVVPSDELPPLLFGAAAPSSSAQAGSIRSELDPFATDAATLPEQRSLRGAAAIDRLAVDHAFSSFPTIESSPGVSDSNARPDTTIDRSLGQPVEAVSRNADRSGEVSVPQRSPRRESETRPPTVVGTILGTALLLGLIVLLGVAYTHDESTAGNDVAPTIAIDPSVSTDDVSHGLYETKAGRPIFFVRGVVLHSDPQPKRIRVKAELIAGSQLLRSVDVVAGAPPTVEELYSVAGLDDVERLRAQVDGRAPAIDPGTRAEFVIPLYEYPQDLSSFRVRVSAATFAATITVVPPSTAEPSATPAR